MADNRSSQEKAAPRHPGDPRLVMAGLFAVALIPMLVTPVMPLIDFYNHLARFYVLAHIGSNSVLQQYYVAHWTLLPDMGVDVLATPLLAFVPPLIAAHILVAGILAVLFSGGLYFHHALTGRRSVLVAMLLLPLLYSYILNWGFANFLLGLGFAFWAAGWWLSYRHRPLLAVPVACLLAIAIFLTHGVAFALYGIIVASLEVGFFLGAPTRRPRDLARSLLLVAIPAIIPVIMFAFWERNLAAGGAAVAQAAPSSQSYLDGLTGGFSHTVLRRVRMTLRVEEGPAYWFDIATFAIQAGTILFLIRRRQIDVPRAAWLLIAVAVILIVLMPSKLFGVTYLDDRMPLFAALVMLCGLCVLPGRWNFANRVAGAILVAVVVARIAVVATSWHAYARDYGEFRILAAKIPAGSLTIGVPLGAGFHEIGIRRCEMYGPLLVAQYGTGGPLFAKPDQQPLLLTGRLKAGVDILSRSFPPEGIRDASAYIAAAASAGFDFELVCNTQLLSQPFPPNVTLVARTAHFALLRAER